MTEPFRDDMTLAEARALLRTMVKDGARCPTCTQMAKVYRRKLNVQMTRLLIAMYREGRRGWVYLPDIPQKSRDGTGIAHWGLIEEETVRRPDGGRVGYWRVTERGEAWLRGQITVPSHAVIYDGRCLRLDGAATPVAGALGEAFDFAELMSDAPQVTSTEAIPATLDELVVFTPAHRPRNAINDDFED